MTGEDVPPPPDWWGEELPLLHMTCKHRLGPKARHAGLTWGNRTPRACQPGGILEAYNGPRYCDKCQFIKLSPL